MIPENKIITFKHDTKERKRFFKAASFAHPAKMILGLQIYLIEHYTKPGDTILDPMAGSGTILIACTLGRNVVLVELEDKFVKMQNENYEKIKSLGPMLGYTLGEAAILQGDARSLDGLLADNILFSPPYAESQCDCEGKKSRIDKYPELQGKGGGIIAGSYTGQKRSKNNISVLPYGEISAVISSPPYAGMNTTGKANSYNGSHGPHSQVQIPDYRQSKDNIGNLPYGKADAVITSPPFERTISGKELRQSEKLIGRKSGKDKWGDCLRLGDSQLHIYSDNGDNIGNLKSENYLEAMLQVYRQCHRVLKEKGLMVLVVKNFIRDKKIIRLDLDTIKLCEKAGFKLIEILKRKLTSQSFWRTIYHNKYPDVEKIEYEDVLVFERAEGI